MIAIFICIIAILGLSLGLWSLNMGDDDVDVDGVSHDNEVQEVYDNTQV